MEELADVGIVGGGPAGLSAALVLGRATRQVVVFDEGLPRNRVTGESHGFLTRDGINPGEFRQVARAQLEAYPAVRIVEEVVAEVAGQDGCFVITTGSGTVFRCRKLLLAVGKKDLPLEIDGLAEVYGKSAFVCPYCDGWELREKPLVLIANGARGMHMAKTLSGWTKQITICTNGADEWTEEQREELRRHHIPVHTSPIKQIQSEAGQVAQIDLEDGASIWCQGIFFAPRLAIGSELPHILGCDMSEEGTIVVDPFGKTSIPGLYSAGDAATMFHQAIYAAAMGAVAAGSINGELLQEAWQEA